MMVNEFIRLKDLLEWMGQDAFYKDDEKIDSLIKKHPLLPDNEFPEFDVSVMEAKQLRLIIFWCWRMKYGQTLPLYFSEKNRFERFADVAMLDGLTLATFFDGERGVYFLDLKILKDELSLFLEENKFPSLQSPSINFTPDSLKDTCKSKKTRKRKFKSIMVGAIIYLHHKNEKVPTWLALHKFVSKYKSSPDDYDVDPDEYIQEFSDEKFWIKGKAKPVTISSFKRRYYKYLKELNLKPPK